MTELLNKLVSSFPSGIQPWSFAVLALAYLAYLTWSNHFSTSAKLKSIREQLDLLKIAIELEGSEKSAHLVTARQSLTKRLAGEIGKEQQWSRATQKPKATSRLRIKLFILTGTVISTIFFIGERINSLHPNGSVTRVILWVSLIVGIISVIVAICAYRGTMQEIFDNAWGQIFFGATTAFLLFLFTLTAIQVFAGLVTLLVEWKNRT
jgi:hypothetical protein